MLYSGMSDFLFQEESLMASIGYKISPTMLSTFVTCPRQYEAKYVTKEVKFQQTKHTIFGNLIHSNIENYLKGRGTLDPILAPMKKILDDMRGRLIGAESKMAIDREGRPVLYNSKSGWLGAITDATIYAKREDEYITFDWKTGKPSDNSIQRDFIGLCTQAQYKDLQRLDIIFVYPFHNKIEQHVWIPGVSDRAIDTRIKIQQLEDAVASGTFEPTPNGLCKQWCDVLSCEYNGRKIK